MGFKITFDDVSLKDICYYMFYLKKTGKLAITTTKIRGGIYFVDGKIVHGETEDLLGLDAIQDLFLKDNGTLQFLPDVKPKKETISEDTNKLISDMGVKADELSQMRQKLPPMTTILERSHAPKEGETSIDLTLQEWQLLSLINGKKTLQAIFDESQLGEYNTCKTIIKLLSSGLVIDPKELANFVDERVNLINVLINEFGTKGEGTEEWCNIMGEHLKKMSKDYEFPKHLKFDKKEGFSVSPKALQKVPRSEIFTVFDMIIDASRKEAKSYFGPMLTRYKYQKAVDSAKAKK